MRHVTSFTYLGGFTTLTLGDAPLARRLPPNAGGGPVIVITTGGSRPAARSLYGRQVWPRSIGHRSATGGSPSRSQL